MTRAATIEVRTVAGAEVRSFHDLCAGVRLQCRGDGGALIATAAMDDRLFRLLVRAAANVLPAPGLARAEITIELSERRPMTEEDAPHADAVRLSATERGLLLIEMLDADGAVVAFAAMNADQFSEFIGGGCDLLEIASKGGLATLLCAGAA